LDLNPQPGGLQHIVLTICGIGVPLGIVSDNMVIDKAEEFVFKKLCITATNYSGGYLVCFKVQIILKYFPPRDSW